MVPDPIGVDSLRRVLVVKLRHHSDVLLTSPVFTVLAARDNIRTATPHRIVGRESVELALRVREPIERAEVRAGDYRKKFRVVSPTEVVKIMLEPKDLSAFREKGEITVSCYQRGKGEKEGENND